jgi:DNA polymerase-3 subunit chi
MVTVDFYHLQPSADRNLFICRLIEKIFSRQHRLYVRCQDLTEANILNDQLWTFSDASFIPHGMDDPHSPIELGCGDIPLHHDDVLLNLANTIPRNYQQVNRILELSAAEHQTYYEKQGIKISHHMIR